MFVRGDMPNHEAALRIVRDALVATQRWPSLSHVRRELHALNGGRLEALEEALDGLMVVDFAHQDDSRVRLTVAGLWEIDRGSRELRHFISALRQCYDAYWSDLGSPSDPNQVQLRAADLLQFLPESVRPGAVAVVGLLFQVEQIASIEESSDPSSPFLAVPDSSILAYGRVGAVADYLEVRHGQTSGSQPLA